MLGWWRFTISVQTRTRIYSTCLDIDTQELTQAIKNCLYFVAQDVPEAERAVVTNWTRVE